MKDFQTVHEWQKWYSMEGSGDLLANAIGKFLSVCLSVCHKFWFTVTFEGSKHSFSILYSHIHELERRIEFVVETNRSADICENCFARFCVRNLCITFRKRMARDVVSRVSNGVMLLSFNLQRHRACVCVDLVIFSIGRNFLWMLNLPWIFAGRSLYASHGHEIPLITYFKDPHCS